MVILMVKRKKWQNEDDKIKDLTTQLRRAEEENASRMQTSSSLADRVEELEERLKQAKKQLNKIKAGLN